MAYLKPPAFTRHVFNPLAMRFGIGGTKTLAVRKRRSGEMQRVPVLPLEYDGDRYVVSARGESDWVRNLRAAGEAELGAGDSTERVHATEVPTAERPPILDAYRKAAGKTVASYFKKLPDPADHPVFRIEPS
jgi:deazaflavin-dependent oxidoreductase (nitroreductase family)